MLLTVLALMGCEPSLGEPILVSGAGYESLTFELPSAIDSARITDVRLGPHRALRPTIDGQALTVWWQGAPEGRWPLSLELNGESVVLDDAVEVLQPEHPAFERIVAMGASLTQGVQGGVPSHRGHLVSPSAQVARVLQVHHPLPVLIDPLLPQIGVADIGPAPDCRVPGVAGWVSSAAAEVLTTLVDPETGEFAYSMARMDPELEPFNIGVGNMDLADYVDGAQSDFVLRFLGHLTYEPNAGLADPLSETPLERVEALEPTMVLIADTYGNDVIGAVVTGQTLDLDRVTDPEVLRPKAEVLFARLAATGAEIFVATLPDPDVLPAAAEKRRRTAANARVDAEAVGDDPDEAENSALAAFDASLIAIIERGDAIRAVVVAEVEKYDNVHIVDLHGTVGATRDGFEVGAEVLYPNKLGGLVSTDGVHFSDTGYGLVANTFLDSIDAALGTTSGRVDLEMVYATDPYAIPSYLAEGFEPADCAR